jgi:hypothetical protein
MITAAANSSPKAGAGSAVLLCALMAHLPA